MGVTLETFVELADPEPVQGWNTSTWPQNDDGEPVIEALANANSSISVTQGIDSYLLPDAMLGWSERNRLLALGWTEPQIGRRITSYTQYSASMRRARASSSNQCVHFAIVREKVLFAPAAENRAWLADIAKNLREWNSKTMLGLAPRTVWKECDKYAKRITKSKHWHRVLVIDQRLAAWWFSPEIFRYTRCPAIVGPLRQELKAVKSLVPSCPNSTQQRLETIALGRY